MAIMLGLEAIVLKMLNLRGTSFLLEFELEVVKVFFCFSLVPFNLVSWIFD